MKLSIGLLVACLTTGMAQRSPYAPKPVGYPTVLDQFNTNNNNNNNAPNRFGGEDQAAYQGPLKPEPGTIGDPYLVPHLPDWPREHQPFWYLNQQHILNHRGQQVPAPVQPVVQQPVAQQPGIGNVVQQRLGVRFGGAEGAEQQGAPFHNNDGTNFQFERRPASGERSQQGWQNP